MSEIVLDAKSVPYIQYVIQENIEVRRTRGVLAAREMARAGLAKVSLPSGGVELRSGNFINPDIIILKAEIATQEFVDIISREGKHRTFIFIVDYTTDVHPTDFMGSTILNARDESSPFDRDVEGIVCELLPLADAVTCPYEATAKAMKSVNPRSFHLPDVTPDRPESRLEYLSNLSEAIEAARKYRSKVYIQRSNNRRPAWNVRLEAYQARLAQELAWSAYISQERAA